MPKDTNWRDRLREHLYNHGSNEQRSWVDYARRKREPLCWEEVCAAWETGDTLTRADIEQFFSEIESIIDGEAQCDLTP